VNIGIGRETKMDNIHTIPLSDIEVDFAWNARSGKWTVDSGDEESADFSDFVASFESPSGIVQHTPVEVRPTPDGPKKYFLVSGYRRYKAIEIASKRLSIEQPSIRAVIKALSPIEARVQNVGENATRQNLSVPDLAWGVWEIQCESKRAGKPLSGTVIAQLLGRNQSYIDKLLVIMRECLPELTKRWRKMPRSMSVADMLTVAKSSREDQRSVFQSMLTSQPEQPDDVRAKNSWIEVSKRKAREIGSLLGRLEAAGLIDTTELDFDDHLHLILKVKEAASCHARRAIAAQLHRAYAAAKQDASNVPRGVDDPA
jgi:hypothetical protein